MRDTSAPRANNGEFNPAVAARLYTILSVVLFMTVLGAGFLQYHITDKQKHLILSTRIAQQQVIYAQQMGAIVAQQQAADTRDMDVLEKLSGMAIAMQPLEPAVRNAMTRAMWNPVGAPPVSGLDGLRALADNTLSYAAYAKSGQIKYMREYAEEIDALMQQNVAERWYEEVAAFVSARDVETQTMIYASFGVFAAVLALLAYQASVVVLPALGQVARQREYLQGLAGTDMQTGLYNRAMLFKVANQLISGARRHQQELAVIAVDIDNFKKLNDTHGRAAGDAAIKVIADVLADVLRNSDVIGRVGGNEFLIFLPSTDEYRATYVAEKLRAGVEAIPFTVRESNVFLTISLGVADMKAGHKTPDDMMRAAETALRQAKINGRNRCVAQGSLSSVSAVQGGA